MESLDLCCYDRNLSPVSSRKDTRLSVQVSGRKESRERIMSSEYKLENGHRSQRAVSHSLPDAPGPSAEVSVNGMECDQANSASELTAVAGLPWMRSCEVRGKVPGRHLPPQTEGVSDELRELTK